MASIVTTTAAGVSSAQEFGPVSVLALGAIDFQPDSSNSYVFVAPGGVRATSGFGRFLAGLRLPVGSRILGVRVYLNPNGQSRDVFLLRFRPRNLGAELLASATSTAGNAVETVSLALSHHDMQDDWSYHLGAHIENGGAHLYGARIRYRLPA
jgi:hypothetical protein